MSTRILLINILLKDKSDLVGVEEFIPNAYILGAMEKPNLPFQDIKVISTKFSKVGKTTLEKYPNLEWVVHRGHGVDSVNLDLCRKRNVGVVATYPNTEGCSLWIVDKIIRGNTTIFGNGVISKRIRELIDNKCYIVDTKTSEDTIQKHLSNSVNVIACVPLTERTDGYFNYELFRDVKHINFISIARANCHNNSDILQLVNENKLSTAHIDILGTNYRDELLNTKKVFYYKHSSWDFLKHKNDHKRLNDIIKSCLTNEVKNPILDRRESLWI